MSELERLARLLQTFGGWGVAAVALMGWAAERIENRREIRRLNQALLDEAHTTTEVVERNDDTWKTAIDLLREIRDGKGRGR